MEDGRASQTMSAPDSGNVAQFGYFFSNWISTGHETSMRMHASLEQRGVSPMPTPEVIREFRARVKRGDLDELQVTYNVSGGMPAEGRIEEEIRISGDRHAEVRSVGPPGEIREASRKLDDDKFRALLKQVADSLDSMMPLSEARFPPDSVIGTITLKVAGEETMLFFNADREALEARASSSTLEKVDAITSLNQLKRELLSVREK